MSSYNEDKRDRRTEVRGQGSVVGSHIPDPRPLTPDPHSLTSGFKSYRDLEVWQKAMNLVVDCYQITKGFPKSEVFGLASQLQRAAVSIAANIAEGRARQHTKEFLQHISIAYGSLAELETHIHIAKRLGYISEDQLQEMLKKASEIGRMLNGLRKSLHNKKKGAENV